MKAKVKVYELFCKECAFCFKCAKEGNDCYIYKKAIELHEWDKTEFLTKLDEWKQYYLNKRRNEVADALDSIITWFYSPESEEE